MKSNILPTSVTDPASLELGKSPQVGELAGKHDRQFLAYGISPICIDYARSSSALLCKTGIRENHIFPVTSDLKYTAGRNARGVTHKGDIFPNKAFTLGELQDLKLLAKDQPSPTAKEVCSTHYANSHS